MRDQSVKTRRWRARAAVAAVAMLAGDILAARVADVVLARESHEAAEREFRTQSDVYHHGLKPSTEIVSRWGHYAYPVKSNSLGFKDRTVRDVPLQSGARRVLFIGDSFTEGVGFAYDDTFVGRVAASLSRRDIEVLNAGIASYSPTIYYAKLKYLLERVGLRVDEVVLLLDVSDIHDEAVFYTLTEDDRAVDAPGAPKDAGMAMLVAQFNPDPTASFKALLKANSATLRLADLVKDRLFGPDWRTLSEDEGWVRATIESPRSAWTFDDRLWREYGEHGRSKAAAAMDKVSALLRDHAIPLTIVVYPWPSQIMRPEGNDRHVLFWKSWSETNGAQFIDLFPRFVGQGAPRDVLHDYSIPLDSHWNQAGHAYVASCFLELYTPRAEHNP
jgi:hypothetical protein